MITVCSASKRTTTRWGNSPQRAKKEQSCLPRYSTPPLPTTITKSFNILPVPAAVEIYLCQLNKRDEIGGDKTRAPPRKRLNNKLASDPSDGEAKVQRRRRHGAKQSSATHQLVACHVTFSHIGVSASYARAFILRRPKRQSEGGRRGRKIRAPIEKTSL